MKWFAVVFLFLASLGAGAQNDPFSSHYMLNPVPYNPAWVGHEPMAHATFQLRSQWTGYSSSFDGQGGAPFTQFLTGAIPIRSSISGAGISIVNDNLGPVSNFMFNIPVAYQLDTRRGTFHFALAPGIFSQTQKFDELRFNDPSDPLNVGSRDTQVNFNLNAGFLYSFSSSAFVGVGVNNILEPGFDYGLDSLQNIMKRSYNLMGGFRRNLSSRLVIAPSVLVRSDLNSFTFDLSVQVLYRDKGWAGLSYRWDEALVFLVGYSFLENNQLKLGYAMDYIVQKQDAKQATSQELFLRYDLPDLVLGGRKRVKTPRFTH